MKKAIASIVILLNVIAAQAKIDIEPIFSDNMVVKQSSDILFWGKAKPSSKVTIQTTWSDKIISTKSDKTGKWEMYVPTPAADLRHHEVKISDGEEIVLKNVVLGEVWLSSGQSNMGMPMAGFKNLPVLGANEAIANCTDDNIRLFKVKLQPSATERETMQEPNGWMQCNPNNLPDFSAVSYFFGRQLRATLGIPVGMIDASLGGSKIQAWMSREALKDFPEEIIPATDADFKVAAVTPTTLYNGAIHPITGYTISGMIWYQGCRNRFEYEKYPAMFKAMVTDYRASWESDFPVYLTQIAPNEFPEGYNSAFIREALVKCTEVVPGTGIAILSDAGNRPNVHSPHKQVVGERLAYQALNKTYGFTGIKCDGPAYDSMTVNGNRAIISFNNVLNGNKGGLTSYNEEIVDFEVAGEDKVFHPAKAIINRFCQVEVWSDEVSVPVAVRYGFKSWFDGNLYNTMGLPASSFRTDDWNEVGWDERPGKR